MTQVNSEELINDYPSQFRIFKKSCALRLQIDKPKKKYGIGCIFLQAAPSNNGDGVKNGYAWENEKISVKLGFNDINSILYGIKTNQDVNLFHTYNEESKSIKFSPKTGGGFFINIEHLINGEKIGSISVPLSNEETGSMLTMLNFSLPLIHNWI